MMRTNG
jgi:hypothetical protein